jgi:hypothetical protein
MSEVFPVHSAADGQGAATGVVHDRAVWMPDMGVLRNRMGSPRAPLPLPPLLPVPGLAVGAVNRPRRPGATAVAVYKIGHKGHFGTQKCRTIPQQL